MSSFRRPIASPNVIKVSVGHIFYEAHLFGTFCSLKVFLEPIKGKMMIIKFSSRPASAPAICILRS